MTVLERTFEYRIWWQIDTDDMQFGFTKDKVTSDTIFTRDSICYSTYMPWQFRLSVRLSVRPSTRVDQSKTVEARITQFSPYSSPIPLVFRR